MYKSAMAYLKKHPMYNATVHVLAGAGVGILLARPLFGPHPVRWGVLLLALGILGHLYPTMGKK